MSSPGLIVAGAVYLLCCPAPLVQRLRDPDERIRSAALTRLIDLACADPASLARETYTDMCDRVKDRRPDVRRLAMVGLARIYNRNVSGALPPLDVQAEGSSATSLAALREHIDSDVLDRLNTIPGVILQCWGYPDIPSKHLVVHLVQEVLLPKSVVSEGAVEDSTTTSSSSPSATGASAAESQGAQVKPKKVSAAVALDSDRRRAAALLLMFDTLSPADRNALASVLNFKSRVRAELQAFLKARATPIKSSRSSDTASRSSHSSSSSDVGAEEVATEGVKALSAEEHAKVLRKCMLRLAQLVPAVDKKASHFEAICAKKDRNVFKLLEMGVTPEDCVITAAQRREDLKQRLVSKSALGEYFGMVFDFASYMLPTAGVVQALLTHLNTLSVSTEAVPCSELLVLLSKYAPQVRFSRHMCVGTR
jgi:hypothetical protein